MSKNTGTSELINYFTLGGSGDVGIGGNLTLSTIVNATVDTDRFLVSDSGVIKYRTGAQLLSDIGGQGALTNPVTGTGTTNVIPKFTGTSTIGDSAISDTATEVNITKRVFITSGVHQFVFTPNLSSASNRIETIGGLPLEITTNGSSIGMNVGGGSSQFSMTNTSASFFIPVTSNGQAATSPAFIANNSTGTSGTAQHYINFTAGTTTIARMLRGNGAAGLVANGLNIDNFDGFGVRLNQLGGSGGTFSVTGGAATFSSTISAGSHITGTCTTSFNGDGIRVVASATGAGGSQPGIGYWTAAGSKRFINQLDVATDTWAVTGATGTNYLLIAQSGLSTFSSSVSGYGIILNHTSENLRLKMGAVPGGLINIQGEVISSGGAYPIVLNRDGGNLGIGVTPEDRLDVNGSIRFRANTPNFTAVTDNAVLDYVPTSIFPTNPTVRIAAIGSASVGAQIRFLTGTSSSLDERIRITSDGTLGFNGSSSPGNAGLDKMSMGYLNGDYGWIQTWNSTRLCINPLGNNVLIGTTTDNGTRLRVGGTAHIPTLTHEPGYHGTTVLVYGPVTSVNIDLPTQFPLMALVGGNVWTVFGKYCGFDGGGVEAREFVIARNSTGGWAVANYGPQSQTNASLQSVVGSGTAITINVDAGVYFTVELTVMIR